MAPVHLLSAETWSNYTRAVSVHLDVDEVEKWIDECEQLFIVPAIGMKLFLRLTSGAVLNEREILLLEGGIYKSGSVRVENDGDISTWDKTFGCSFTEEDVLFKGLRHALAYFVLAKMIRNDGGMLSRGGYFRHEDEHANHYDYKNNVNRYNDAMNVAETYLNGALLYAKEAGMISCNKERVRGTRVRIISVGE